MKPFFRKNIITILWVISTLFILIIANTQAITWINWYWSDGDYSNPNNNLSWSIQVWSWQSLTWTIEATFTNAVELSNAWASAIIPNGTTVGNSQWTNFDVTSISTNILSALPLALPSNSEQDVWKIKFWINWINLYFSKPVKLQIPVNTTSSTVKIYAIHAWVSWYQTYSLTNILASNCNNWYASPSSNIATVLNWIATIYTCSASSFVAVSNINQQSISYWGWWWGSRLIMDNCPNGDFSKSYYDRDCWTNPIEKNNNKEKEETKNNNELLNDYEEIIDKKRIVDYKWINILVIDWYKLSRNVNIVTKRVIESESLSIEDKQKFVDRINQYLLSKYNLDIARKRSISLKNQYIKQYFLLKKIIWELRKSIS